MSIKEHEKKAIHNFLIHVTLPILGIAKVEDRLEEALIGTGTLFKIIGRRFIVTANHTMDSFPIGDWLLPEGPRKGPTRPIVSGQAYRPTDKNADFSVIELTDPNLIEVLECNYRFLTLENIWLPDLSADAIYVAGYPSLRTRREGKNLKGNLFVFKSQFRDDTPEGALNSEDAVTKGVDFFVRHRDGTNELTGENVSREGLYGMSGCAVWGYRERGWTPHGWAEHDLWKAEAVMRVIGVQSSFAENSYIRAKSWGGVLGLLGSVDEQMSAEVKRVAKKILTLIGLPPPEDEAEKA